jgi:hypothetical protein
MTAGQTVNLCGSIAALSGSLAFVLVYSVFAPWWRSRVGRLLVFKALAIAAFMTVSVLSYAVDPKNRAVMGVLLLVRGVLAAGFGAAMTYQAWLVGYTQTKSHARKGTADVFGSKD